MNKETKRRMRMVRLRVLAWRVLPDWKNNTVLQSTHTKLCVIGLHETAAFTGFKE